MPNKDLTQPPVYIKSRDDTTKLPTPEWNQWFNDVHRQLSTRNHQTITSARAVDESAQYVAIDSTSGAFAITLAAPNVPNVTKVMEMTADGGDVTMALTNVIGGSAGTTCTWNDVRDILVLKSASDKWVVLNEIGVSLT